MVNKHVAMGVCEARTRHFQVVIVFGALMALLSGCSTAKQRTVIMLGGSRVAPATHAIFLPEKPTITEQTAADELRLHLQLVTGQTLEVLPETARGDRHGFFVGRSVVHALSVTELALLGKEGLVIRSEGQDLLLAGNRRGVLYAVSVFLEDHVGCRWLAPDCTSLPGPGVVRLGNISRRVVPRLSYRYTDYDQLNRNPLFAMRLRINTDQYHPEMAHEEYGGYVRFHPFCHTFGALVPVAQYFDAHPEYFSLVDGQRRRERTQLCLTNPDVVRISKTQVRKWIAEDPRARFIEVSIDDLWEESACQCPNCKAVDDKEGSRAGTLIHFVNAIADDVKDDYPWVLISTLAYNYTQRAPLHVRPRPNVAVRLCSYHCSFARPLAADDYVYNRQFLSDLKAWSAIAKHLIIWDYTVNFGYALAPFPNFDTIKPNLREFLDLGVEGVYEQGSYYGRGCELAELRTYLIAKLLWDPDYDVQRAIREFTDGYYGPAAPYLRQYVELMHERVRADPSLRVGVGTTYGTAQRLITNTPAEYLPEDFIPRAQALFAAARRAATDDPVVMRRVRLAQLPALYMLMQQKALYTRKGDRLVESNVAGVSDWAEEFRQVVADERITHAWEQGPIADLLARLKRRPPALGVERLRAGKMEVELLPEFGGEIIALRGGDVHNWVHCFGGDGRVQPEDSGIKEFSARVYNSPGWCERFDVVARSPSNITLRASLANGLEMERVISVQADRPAVRIRSMLRNSTKEPREACLRVHPVFSVPDPARASLIWQTKNGDRHSSPLPHDADPKGSGGDRRFQGVDLPTQWGIVDGTTGSMLQTHLISGDLECVYCWADWPQRWITLELWSAQRKLQPGESITMEYEYTLDSHKH